MATVSSGRLERCLEMTTFVLVSGAWHGAWCWYKVVPILERAGHTVITPDLPSLGRDVTPTAEVSLAMCRDAVCEVIDAQPGPVVLVGHSRAGVVISEVAERRADRISALVYLAALLPTDGASASGLATALSHSAAVDNMVLSADGTSVVVRADALRAAFYAECSDEDVTLARSCIRPEPAAVFHATVTITDDRFGSVPRDYIECLRDNAIPIADQRRMQEAQPCRQTFSLDSDHSPFFSDPDELARVLADAYA
jgi:pimeloyl-ACP methyl ester carboxylesterase